MPSLPPTQSHSLGAGSIEILSIIVAERVREDTVEWREYISNSLAVSIAEVGLIHPPTLEKHDEKEGKNAKGETIQSSFTLIAGRSRLEACLLLGYTVIPYCMRESQRPGDVQMMELEENIRRHAMTWQEETKGIYRIHHTYRNSAHERSKRWGITQTGHLLGVSSGHVSYTLKVAEALIKGDPEICSCPHFAATRTVYATRKQDEIAGEQLKRNAHFHKSVKKTTKPLGEAPLAVIQKLAPTPGLIRPSVLSLDPLKKTNEPEHHTVDLSAMLFNLDNRDWFSKRQTESVDLIYTDIPYGIDMDNLDLADIERVEDEHDVEENVEQMRGFIQNSYRVLRPDSYLLFWMDIKHWEKTIAWGLEAGFSVQPYPLLWIKSHSCKNGAAYAWWTKNFEYVCVMRKGKATLKTPQHSAYCVASGSAERKLQNNPFAKPFEFSQWLLKPILFPGMTVLDCYAGEGSTVRALLNLGANVIAVEKKAIHFNRLVEHVKTYYRERLRGDITFI